MVLHRAVQLSYPLLIKRLTLRDLLSIISLMLLMTESSAGLNNYSGKEQATVTPDATVVAALLSPNINLKTIFPEQSVPALFLAVRNKVRFEPYRGAQRGALGTARVRCGNSLDQSLLLMALLRQLGYQVRLVEGELASPNIKVLLRGIYPPEVPQLDFSDDYAPYHVDQNDELSEQVKTHYWVEVNQGDNWLPLDPSYPRAKAGEAYAKPTQYFDELPQELQQYLTIRLLRKTPSQQAQKIYEITKPIMDLNFRPLLLSSTGTFLVKPHKKSAPVGSSKQIFGGALSGKTHNDKPIEKQQGNDETLGIRYVWQLHIPDEGIIENEYTLNYADKKSFIDKEWLEFELHIPSQPVQRFSRIIFQKNSRDKLMKPSKYRRFDIGFFSGSVAESQTKNILNKVQALPIANWQALSKSSAKDNSHVNFAALTAMDASMNLVILHSALLRFVASSDLISDQTAYANGVALIRSVPRVLIASVESESGQRLKFNLDLRLDEVMAIPFPGAPEKLSHLYQLGRGISESVQEGKILQILTDSPVITTASLMKRVADGGIPLKTVEQDNFSQVTLPKSVRNLLRQDLEVGWNAIIPAQPINIEGSERWGWWLVNPKSGRTIGKMDDQLNSAMAEYTLSSNDIGLNPNMGFVVGMIVGADSTLFAISSGILKYGEVSAAMIKEIKEYLKSVTCSTCPDAEAKLTAIEVSLGGDCYKIDISTSAKISSDFCSKYADGFKCAAGMLLAGLSGEKILQTEVKVGELSVKAACSGASTKIGGASFGGN